MYFFEISVIMLILTYFILKMINKAFAGLPIYNMSGLTSQEYLITPSAGTNADSIEFQAGKQKKKEKEEEEDEQDDDYNDDDDFDDDWDEDWDEEDDFGDDEEWEEESWEEEVIKSRDKNGRLC